MKLYDFCKKEIPITRHEKYHSINLTYYIVETADGSNVMFRTLEPNELMSNYCGNIYIGVIDEGSRYLLKIRKYESYDEAVKDALHHINVIAEFCKVDKKQNDTLLAIKHAIDSLKTLFCLTKKGADDVEYKDQIF